MDSTLKAVASIVSAIGIFGACSLDKLVDVDKPQTGTEVDHDYLDTRVGALSLLYTALGQLQAGVSVAALEVGLTTDELTSRPPRTTDYQYFGVMSSDSRFEPVDYYGVKGIQFKPYSKLQSARVHSGYARYFLRRLSDSTVNYAISAAYSIEGYAITMLAENVCSGVPLSESQYGQSTVYGEGISTDSLLKIAVAKFDSALAIQHDSLPFITLAKVGKARALLSLGRYAEASTTAADVAQSDVYQLHYTESTNPNQDVANPSPQYAYWPMSPMFTSGDPYAPYLGHEIVSREGGNGMVWFINPEEIDPRVPLTVEEVGGVKFFPMVIRQTKFVSGYATFPLASWIDAQMVHAEYLLSLDDPSWINPINAARQAMGMADTVAPTARDQQVNLLFRERAFWFYGQATRLADMRRLVRQYGRQANAVFPIGQYTRSDQVYTYGDATVFVPDTEEFRRNHKYSGCINRNP